MDASQGRVVFNERGYIIVELLSEGGTPKVIGYRLAGPRSSAAIIYSTRLEALEALQDIEEPSSGI